jgi:hypothetical protein
VIELGCIKISSIISEINAFDISLFFHSHPRHPPETRKILDVSTDKILSLLACNPPLHGLPYITRCHWSFMRSIAR